jgi:hypothetical protein
MLKWTKQWRLHSQLPIIVVFLNFRKAHWLIYLPSSSTLRTLFLPTPRTCVPYHTNSMEQSILRSQQLLSWSINYPHFVELGNSLPCSKQPADCTHHPRPPILKSILILSSHLSRAMVQTVSRRLTAEARVRYRVGPCGNCDRQSGTGTGFPPSTSAFPCQFHSTGAPLHGKTKKLIIFITRLHNKPQGCGASVAYAAGPSIPSTPFTDWSL